MSWSFKQTEYNWAYPASSSGQSLTFGSNCTPGSLLIAEVSCYVGSPANNAVSDPTNGTWNFVANEVGGYGNVSFYWIINTASTALTVSWGSSGSLPYPSFQICEFTGNAASSPLDTFEKNSDTDSLSCPVNNANELVVGVPCPSVGGAMEAVSPWTSTDPGDSSGQPIIYGVYSSAASPTFTNAGGVIVASFQPTAAATVAPSLVLLGFE